MLNYHVWDYCLRESNTNKQQQKHRRPGPF